MQAVTVPSADEWFDSTTTPFPYTKSFEEARWEPLIVLHTSGSTGVPKPIVVRQGSLAVADSYHNLPDYQGASFFFTEWVRRSKRLFLPMPMFHAIGTFCMLSSILYELPMAMPLPGKPLNVDVVIECLAHAGVDSAVLPPAILEGISATEEGIKAVVKLAFVSFGGGNLSPVAGNILANRGAVLNNIIGSTEFFPYAEYFQPNPKLWQYFIFNSEVMGTEWRLIHEPDEYELVARRKDPKEPGYQGCFYTFPDLSEWCTKDIFRPHPTLKDHWIYQGRADDVIVFSNGEKLNPVTIEGIVTGHPAVNGTLVVGQDKFQAAMVLEPVVPPKDEAAAEVFIDEVWPWIEKANSETVAHGRIVRSLVAVSDPGMPFLRAGKGTVLRPGTVKLYHDFIESLYEKADAADEEDLVVLDIGGEQPLMQSVIDLFETKVGTQGLQPETDFFSAGVDSLQVMSASNLLRAGLKAANVHVHPTMLAARVIYQNPTPRRLAAYLYAKINEDGSTDENEHTREVREMESILSKYTANLPEPKSNTPDPVNEGQTVIVTGTTGSLGAYMLDRLCRLPSVKKVIAFNRGQDGGSSRQPYINESRGLTTDFSKVEFLGTDLSLPDFGLGATKYSELLADVDRIIHNAWPVNFNISVASFEPYIRGVRHLADFSNAATKNVPVVFVSSIGTVDRWTSPEPFPETRLDDFNLQEMGYGRSKLVGSLILDAAVERSGIPAASVRVGQIAGPRKEKGVWNRQEFIPSLIASSVYLGLLPDHLGTQQEVAWTPVEDIAGLILDVTGITAPKPVAEISGYFHGVNPATVQWPELAPTVKNFYSDRIKKIVSLEDWVAALEASAGETADLEKNPGVKLLDTYRGMLAAKQRGQTYMRFAMDRTKSQSATVRELGPITAELMENWCRQWNY